MRTLMVTPYPPIRDGIANYAVQEVRRMRAAGEDVEVLSPQPSAAHHHLDLRSRRGPLALAKRVRAYDRVIIQFHPDLFYPVPLTRSAQMTVTTGLLAAFAACRNLEVRVHEVDFEWGRTPRSHRSLFRALWRIPDVISVHTEREREQFVDAFGVKPARVQLFAHGAHFERRTNLDQAAARRRLGLPEAGFRFLSIGFVQPHKGFDRALAAFAAVDRPDAHLDIVGSLRVEEPEFVDYVERLQRNAARTANATMHLGYVSDEQFDLWLVASDCVVLPYHHSWSSGVLERAALYGRQVITTRVGGLGQQAPEGTILVDNDTELAEAMRRAAGGTTDFAPVERLDHEEAVRLAGTGAIQARLQQIADTTRRAAPHAFADVDSLAGASLDAAHAVGPGEPPAVSTIGDPLATLGPLVFPPVTARNPVAAAAKRAVRRLTLWELQPVIEHVNRLQRAATDATRRHDTDRTEVRS